MKYALLVYEDESVYGPGKDNEAVHEIVGRHQAFQQQVGAAKLGGSGLAPTSSATTVRTVKGKQTVHDGPFAETKEQLGGFYLIEAADLDAAIAIARKVPVLRDGSIEVRPVFGPG